MRKRTMTAGLLALMLIPQLVPVERANPPVRHEIPAPERVLAVLRHACYDCHSNETRWPWYSHVAPFSWLVTRDVNRGREAMNFSEWDAYGPSEQRDLIELSLNEIDKGRMPLRNYLRLHPEAQIGEAQRAVLESWIPAD